MHSFQRLVDWNHLEDNVVCAKTVEGFSSALQPLSFQCIYNRDRFLHFKDTDKYWEHQDVKFEYNEANIQNKENTGNHTEISCIKEEVEVDIVTESQCPQMT